MRKAIENFDRMDLFEHYHSKTNPFSFVTTKIDITNLYHFCKKHKNVYATIGYYVSLAMNKVDAFKYRYEDGKIYYYDVLKPAFTQMFKDGNIGFFACPMKEDYSAFIKEFNLIQDNFLRQINQIVVWTKEKFGFLVSLGLISVGVWFLLTNK